MSLTTEKETTMQLASRFSSRAPSIRSAAPLTDDQIAQVVPSIFAAEAQRATTRPINGIDQNVKVNRALWVLAEEMRKLVA